MDQVDSTGKTQFSVVVNGNSVAVESTKTFNSSGTLTGTSTFNPALKGFPSSTTAGFSEAQTVAFTSPDGNGSLSCTLTVKGIETVTVTAGTYQNTLKVQQTCKNGGSTVIDTYTWFALGVGDVKEQDVTSGEVVQMVPQAASTKYTISGSVTANGAGLPNVAVSTTGASATTNSSGNYTLSGLANGTYTITPSLNGYTFNPVNRTPTINSANVTGQNFTATSNTTSTTNKAYIASGGDNGYTISGTICQLSNQFQLTATHSSSNTGGDYVTSYIPTDSSGMSGTLTYTGTQTDCTMSGSGTYILNPINSNGYSMSETSTGCVTCGVYHSCGPFSQSFTLTPTTACSGG